MPAALCHHWQYNCQCRIRQKSTICNNFLPYLRFCFRQWVNDQFRLTWTWMVSQSIFKETKFSWTIKEVHNKSHIMFWEHLTNDNTSDRTSILYLHNSEFLYIKFIHNSIIHTLVRTMLFWNHLYQVQSRRHIWKPNNF